MWSLNWNKIFFLVNLVQSKHIPEIILHNSPVGESLGIYQGCSPRKKQALPRPAPWNWQNPRGTAGQNWLQIPLMVPFHDTHKLCIRGRKYFHLTLWTDCDYLVHIIAFLKWKDIMFPFKGNIKTSIVYYKYLNNNLRTVVYFLGQSIYALFCPAPRIFTFAPPRGFLTSPRPASPRWKKL